MIKSSVLWRFAVFYHEFEVVLNDNKEIPICGKNGSKNVNLVVKMSGN